LAAKLVSGKNTFIHRVFWPSVLAIGIAREPWQMKSLDAESRELLTEVDGKDLTATGKSALRLEQLLLVHSEQIHTEGGSHAKILTSWKRWAKRSGVKPATLPSAKASLEKALNHLNRQYGGRGRLPWPT
jgi:hypothetical protein